MNSVISSKSSPPKIAFKTSVDPLSRVVGRSAAMRRLEEAIARVSNVDCPVLLTGETGSGKDEAARAIHAAGSRAARPLVPINCAGIVGTLAESLLFGHEKGSFTGADDSAIGAFRAAHGGIPARDAGSARPATAAAWRRRRPTSSTASSRRSPSGSG
jgi:DNA-binding NtrC family response regulator